MAALFSWGANSYGQLCLGHKEDTLEPSICQVSVDLLENVRAITGGGGHTMLLTNNGELWCAGWNSSGQLGLEHREDLVELSRIPLLPRVVQVDCGWNHTLALSESGEVFVWGSNSFGQLGLEAGPSIVSTPQVLDKKVFGGECVIGVSAGLRHSLVVTESGAVFGFGSNKKGQICCSMTGIKGHVVKTPRLVTRLQGQCIRAAVASSTHSVAVSVEGDLFAWGLNDRGQCSVPTAVKNEGIEPPPPSEKKAGLDEEGGGRVVGVERVDVPLRVEGLGHVVAVSSGWTHVTAKNSEGKVFVWGRNTYGELGLGEDSPQQMHVPIEVACLRGVDKIVSGSEHNLAVDASGMLLSWGWNEHGMCGDGTETDVKGPKPISKLKNMKIIEFGTGYGHSLALCEQRL